MYLPSVFRPDGEAGDDRGAGPGGDLRKGGVGAGGSAKEVDKDAFLQRSVLID